MTDPLSHSPWHPLRHPVFRALWLATVASNVGTWMHDTAATWLMTTLTASTLMVALMQTATNLPVLFLALPAGALADVVDRRKLLIVTQTWMLAAAMLLGALTLAGRMTPWLLLSLTFLLGLGTALNTPAWQATTADLVERPELPAAVSLSGVATNIARAIGPALGGLLVAAISPGGVFLLNALSFLGIIVVLSRWQPTPRESVLPAERVLGAMRAGVRYLRHAPEMRAVHIRTGAFVLFASALWALLPVVARHELGLDAVGYGALLGSLGVGAIAGVALPARLRARLSTDHVVALGSVIFAAVTALLATVRTFGVLCAALFVGGIAWITVMPSFNVATQRASPDWIRARMLALYVLMFQGGMAIGSALWGAVASSFGVRVALLAAAIGMVVALATMLRWRLVSSEGLDLAPSSHWRDPVLTREVSPEEGPVLITVEYRVAPENADAFTRAMRAIARLRRRDGAVSWGLFRDTANPERFVETFVSESWGEHLRQHARATMTDRRVEAEARAFHKGPDAPIVAHLVQHYTESSTRE
jgi:MFS family permease